MRRDYFRILIDVCTTSPNGPEPRVAEGIEAVRKEAEERIRQLLAAEPGITSADVSANPYGWFCEPLEDPIQG